MISNQDDKNDDYRKFGIFGIMEMTRGTFFDLKNSLLYFLGFISMLEKDFMLPVKMTAILLKMISSFSDCELPW